MKLAIFNGFDIKFTASIAVKVTAHLLHVEEFNEACSRRHYTFMMDTELTRVKFYIKLQIHLDYRILVPVKFENN